LKKIDWKWKKRKNDTSKIFGDYVPALLKLIERHKKDFQHNIFGPIGAHVKVKDNSWALAVEEALTPRNLNAFVCGSPKDEIMLRDFCRKEKVSPNFPIIIQPPEPRYYIDPKDKDLPASHYYTVLKSIDIENDQIFNALVNQAQIERVVLLKTDKEGSDFLYEGIPGAKFCFTPDGAQYKVNFSTKNKITSRKKSPTVFVADFSQNIANIEKELKRITQELKNKEEERSSIQDQFNASRNDLIPIRDSSNKLQIKLNQLQKKEIQDITQDQEQEAEEEPDKAEDIEQSLKEQEKQLQELNEEKETTERKVALLNEKIQPITQEMIELHKKYEEIEKRINKLRSDINSSLAQATLAEQQMNNCDLKIQNHNEKKQAALIDLQNKQNEVKQASELALENHPRIETNKSPKTIEQDIKQKEKQIEKELNSRKKISRTN